MYSCGETLYIAKETRWCIKIVAIILSILLVLFCELNTHKLQMIYKLLKVSQNRPEKGKKLENKNQTSSPSDGYVRQKEKMRKNPIFLFY